MKIFSENSQILKNMFFGKIVSNNFFLIFFSPCLLFPTTLGKKRCSLVAPKRFVEEANKELGTRVTRLWGREDMENETGGKQGRS